MTKYLIILFLCASSFQGVAQEINTNTKKEDTTIFPEKCLGVWKGVMNIYHKGRLKDSVNVRFTASKTTTPGTYVWKTEYLSSKKPMVKDYKLVIDDINEGRYLLDEGNDIQLTEYVVGNKMRSLFKVEDIYLTSTTELIGDQLIFEVTSGKEIEEVQNIKNYSFTNVQRMVLHKIE
ncbi:hypothetical protein GCM10009430_22470 [Aquimarina litoralis]|uniref:Lipocalin-like domain-containing protein n=1 Tax=Aquimarina litoralis TaxID=584605 RepID=A0ABP3U478_9FLAO